MVRQNSKNVLGSKLRVCCGTTKTGYFRDGYCRTDNTDYGSHVICAKMTTEFLEFTKNCGNDLSTPRPEYRFPGLKPGDWWCLCASRWKEAWQNHVAPPVRLESCDQRALEIVSLDILEQYSIKDID